MSLGEVVGWRSVASGGVEVQLTVSLLLNAICRLHVHENGLVCRDVSCHECKPRWSDVSNILWGRQAHASGGT
jgi:hypothetical protein